MEEPAILEALAAYARTAMEPVKSPATAAPVITALDGFMIQFLFGIGFGFARLRKTRVGLSVVSSFLGQKFSGQCKRGRDLRGERDGPCLLRWPFVES
ncbi:MAG: hypothetical protein QOH31_3618 [Verrucomicrobiota bacterium]|jgi:hypothetical protein